MVYWCTGVLDDSRLLFVVCASLLQSWPSIFFLGCGYIFHVIKLKIKN